MAKTIIFLACEDEIRFYLILVHKKCLASNFFLFLSLTLAKTNANKGKYRVSHCEECKVNQLWGVFRPIILLSYGA